MTGGLNESVFCHFEIWILLFTPTLPVISVRKIKAGSSFYPILTPAEVNEATLVGKHVTWFTT